MDRRRFLERWQPGIPQAVAVPLAAAPPPLEAFARLRPAGAALLESAGGPADITGHTLVARVARTLELPSASPERPGDVVAEELERVLRGLPGPRALEPELPEGVPVRSLPFLGGWICVLAYELGRAFERIPALQPPAGPPPVTLLEAPSAVVYDHRTGGSWAVACLEPGPSAEATWDATRRELDILLERLASRDSGETHAGWALDLGEGAASSAGLPFGFPGDPGGELRLLEPLRSSHSREEYLDIVRAALEFIHAGDIFQVNLSQHFSARVLGDPWTLYRRLRAASPAPFAAFIEARDLSILSSSPERFLASDGQRIETRPIKGTIRRGASPDEDRRLSADLYADPKERSEHVMIVDLSRNDLGRVAAPDSVEVGALMRVEEYPQMHHLVSIVRARLARELSFWELLKATFPGASITGAPKVRAMEIIEDLERGRRGIYTGAVGYLCRSGRLDLNIAIRTLVIHEGRLHLQVGGGIVAASVPDREYEETLLKSRGMCAALGLLPEDRSGSPLPG